MSVSSPSTICFGFSFVWVSFGLGSHISRRICFGAAEFLEDECFVCFLSCHTTTGRDLVLEILLH